MSITEPDRIDVIGVDKHSGRITLAIADDLEWDDADPAHAEALQSKVRAYVRYISGKQLLEAYPDAKERGIRIELVLEHDPDFGGIQLLREIGESLDKVGIEFTYFKLPDEA